MTAKKHQPAPITRPATAESIVRPTSAPPPEPTVPWPDEIRIKLSELGEMRDQIKQLTAENERLNGEIKRLTHAAKEVLAFEKEVMGRKKWYGCFLRLHETIEECDK